MPELQEDRRPFVHWLASRVRQKEFLELRATMDVMERYLANEGQSANSIYRAARNFDRNILEKYKKKFQGDSCFHYLHSNRTEAVQRIFSYLIEFASWRRYSGAKPVGATTGGGVICRPQTDASSDREKMMPAAGEGQMDQSAERIRCSEVDELLKDEKFLPLRKKLAQKGICTLDQLRALNLWSFMNHYELYSIGTRQKVLEDVTALLYPAIEADDSKQFILQVGNDAYKGDTPSCAFRSFCDEMLRRYPLRLRLLAGSKMRDGSIPVHLTKDEDQLQKLTNFSAYIRGNLSKEEVARYAEWICSECDEDGLEICVTEPQKTIYEPHQEEQLQVAESSYHARQEALDEVPQPPHAKPQADEVPQTPPAEPQVVSPEVERVEQLVFDADMDGMSYERLKKDLGMTLQDAKKFVAAAMHIVDIKERLIHQDAFVDWDDGADQLEDILEKQMQKNDGYVSSTQLFEFAKVEMSMFLNDNGMNEERMVYDMAQHLFKKVGYHGKRYKFTGKMHISRLEDNITSNFDIYKKYAKDQGGVFSFSALAEYLERMGIATGNLRMQMRVGSEPVFFYYESDILMDAESMHVDTSWMDAVKKALGALLAEVGGHIILRHLPDAWLMQLPSLPGGRPWTPLLLQSVLRCYSEQLNARTIPAMRGQSVETLHAMLVTGDNAIQNFGDVVVTWMMDDDIEQRNFEAEELREDLVDAGILRGNELIWKMPKALKQDERFAWDASGSRVTIKVR